QASGRRPAALEAKRAAAWGRRARRAQRLRAPGEEAPCVGGSSSAAEKYRDVAQHRLEHSLGKPVGLRIIAAAVVAIEEPQAWSDIGQLVHRVVRETPFSRETERHQHGAMGDRAEREDRARTHARDLLREIPVAAPDFFGLRLVLR